MDVDAGDYVDADVDADVNVDVGTWVGSVWRVKPDC